MSGAMLKVYEFIGNLVIEHPLGYALGCLIAGLAMNIANFWMLAKMFGLL